MLPRVSDVYAAMPGITGKLELEYEGEMKGADIVVRDLIRTAVGKVYEHYFEGVNTEQIEQWFNLGGTVKMDEDQPAAAALKEFERNSRARGKADAAMGVKHRRRCTQSSRRGGISVGRIGSASQTEPATKSMDLPPR